MKQVMPSLLFPDPAIQLLPQSLVSSAPPECLMKGFLDELHRINEDRCDPPLPQDEIETIARSIARYTQGDPTPQVLFGGKPGGLLPSTIQMVDDSATPDIARVEEETPEPVVSIPHPVFPTWVMEIHPSTKAS